MDAFKLRRWVKASLEKELLKGKKKQISFDMGTEPEEPRRFVIVQTIRLMRLSAKS